MCAINVGGARAFLTALPSMPQMVRCCRISAAVAVIAGTPRGRGAFPVPLVCSLTLALRRELFHGAHPAQPKCWGGFECPSDTSSHKISGLRSPASQFNNFRGDGLFDAVVAFSDPQSDANHFEGNA